MTILSTPALRDYEQLILFVKPFCAFFKQCKTIDFFLISYKCITQILQTISSIIISYKQPLPSLRCVCSAGKGFSCENIFLKRRIVRLYGKGVVYEQKYFYQLVISRPSHKSNR